MRKIVSLTVGSDAEVDRLLSQRDPLTAHECYQEAVLHFRTHCFNWHSPTVSPGPQAAGLRTPPSLGPPAWPLRLCILNPKSE